MHATINYTGSPGNISASLTVDGKFIDSTVTDNHKQAQKWAKRRAREYKEDTAPASVRRHDVFITVSGEKSFEV